MASQLVHEKEQLLPQPNSPQPRVQQRSKAAKLLKVASASAVIAGALLLTATTRSPLLSRANNDGELYASSKCPVQPPVLSVGSDWNPGADPAYVKTALARLQGAIRIPTQSYDDMRLPDNDERFKPQAEFSAYLEATFPLVHQHLKLDRVQTYGRLYTWKGADPSLKPIVLMAHQDVVPVNADSLNRWTYPPFDATLDKDGWIWGRGVADCKNTLIGMLSAAEQHLAVGYVPARTILFSFGFDEEIGGSRSAKPLSELIQSRYGPNGVSLILDEGFTGVDTGYNVTFARFGLAEKGAINVKLDVLTPGGHSSVPQRHTGIGILAKLLVSLEEHPAEIKLEGNPVLSYLSCAAEYGSVDKSLKKKITNPKKWLALGEELAEADPTMRAFLGTTQAADLINGGIKVNALPEFSTATVNYRIDFQSSVHETVTRLAKIVEPVVKAYNLTFSLNGAKDDVTNNVVRMTATSSSAIEPAPITPTSGPAWNLMGGTVKAVFGKDVIVAPSGMIANTDTKWFWPLTKNIYRFTPAAMDQMTNFHTVDERLHTDAHISTIVFYHKLMLNLEGWKG